MASRQPQPIDLVHLGDETNGIGPPNASWTQSGNDHGRLVNDKSQETPPHFPRMDASKPMIVQPDKTMRASQKRKRSPPSPPKKLLFDQAMNNVVMRLFLECKREGLFGIEKGTVKKKDYTLAWDRVCIQMRDFYPQYRRFWTRKAITDKFANEKRRYRVLKDFLKMSGTSYDEETGLPVGSDEQWETFISHAKTQQRKVAWLRSIPLGDRDVYEEVFSPEEPPGNGEAVNIPINENEDHRQGNGPKRNNHERSAPSKRRRTQAPQSQSETDEDSDESDGAVLVSLSYLIRTLCQSIDSMVKAMGDIPGADDLKKASWDVQDRFGTEYTSLEVVHVISRFHEMKWAVHYNSLKTEKLKREFFDQWKGSFHLHEG